MGRNQYWAGRVYDLSVYYMTGTPEGSTESGEPFASLVTSDIWLIPFNSRTPIVTEFIVKNSKKFNF